MNIITNIKILSFLKYFSKYKLRLGVIFLLVIATTSINVIVPYFTALTIDNYIANQNKTAIDTISIIASVVFLFLAFCSYNSTLIVGTLSQTVLNQLRIDLFTKIQSLPMQFFIQNSSGDIISRLNNDTRKLDNFLSRYIFEFISTFFTFIGIGLYIFTQNIQLALYTWLGVIGLIVFSAIVGPYVRKASQDQLQINSEITTYINTSITNYKAVVAFNQQSNIAQNYETLVTISFWKSFKSRFLTGMFRNIYKFSGIVTQGIVLLIGVSLISKGEIKAGILLSFVFYSQIFYEPLVRLAAVFGAYQQAFGAWSRINDVFELDPKNPNLKLNQDTNHQTKDIDE